MGLDKIHPRTLKEVHAALVETYIIPFRYCLDSGVFPTSWKANNSPFSRKEIDTRQGGTNPLVWLSTAKSLSTFRRQPFRRICATTHLPIKLHQATSQTRCLVDSLRHGFDGGMVSHVILTDYAKVFDRVLHILLLYKPVLRYRQSVFNSSIVFLWATSSLSKGPHTQKPRQFLTQSHKDWCLAPFWSLFA